MQNNEDPFDVYVLIDNQKLMVPCVYADDEVVDTVEFSLKYDFEWCMEATHNVWKTNYRQL